MYIVVDTISRNVLGEFEQVAQAKNFFLELVAADPAVVPHLKILSKSGEKQTVPRERVREAASSAAASV